jgi:WD repeat-containing protein 19
LNINNLDNLEKAKTILRNKCPTVTCASMVANYCEKRGMKKDAIEFMIMANRKEEAFILAQSHGEMETYSSLLKDVTPEERIRVAQFYEGKSQWGLAARQYDMANNHQRALKLYMQADII